MHNQALSRERFLRLTAGAAVGATVAARAASVPGAAAQTATYKEAPMLASMVAAGQLPPVSERLPERPYVPPHSWLSTGRYGGTMRLAMRYNDLDIAKRVANYMYGHSPLRWLRDGLEIGPGFAEKWETNEDASVWTFYLRKGIKWSDGQPFTVDDILFWWEDEVKVDDVKELPPDETRSGKGTLATFVKLDDFTFQMVFDAPAPLTADRLAMWVKRGVQDNTVRWVDPKHYLSQFHIKYNPSLDPKTWTEVFLQKRQQLLNPECPTLAGWKLEALVPGQRQTWVRNPYYWAVDKDGNQLPYLDRIVATQFQDAEVLKLQFTSGQVDFMQGNQAGEVTLSDVQTLVMAEPRSNLEVRFWDSGSGTGSMYFFNWNFKNAKMRELIRNTTFRKALSHAFNRAQVQKAIYFNLGETTAGTLSPKAIEYQIEGGPGIYAEWRSSAMQYDPDRATQLLDSIGVIDRNGDGWRELPDGSPLEVTLDYAATTAATSDDVRKNEFLARDWQSIGIKTSLNPVPQSGSAYDDKWEAGEFLMKTAWEVGDGPNHLVYPQWLVPMERQRWAPLNGRWYEVKGTPKQTQELEKNPYDRTPPREPAEPGSPIDRLWQIYDQTKVEPDAMKRHAMVWDMIKIHIQDGPFFSGSVANPPRVVLVKKGLLNVPARTDLALGGFVNPWIHPTPAVYDPETWYWDNPAAHQ
ncbi:MAG TPA: ABC transporter substrate-binding protein [Chloroflexota bacterium]|nr:ABC transporter substrate-binding protein [Chloroflexota bacterium]